jgi:hypothetical protein
VHKFIYLLYYLFYQICRDLDLLLSGFAPVDITEWKNHTVSTTCARTILLITDYYIVIITFLLHLGMKQEVNVSSYEIILYLNVFINYFFHIDRYAYYFVSSFFVGQFFFVLFVPTLLQVLLRKYIHTYNT